MSLGDTARRFNDNLDTQRRLLDALQPLAAPLEEAADLIGYALLAGRKLLCCGNGGSAADSAHFAAEIAGRFELDRPGFPALDLTTPHTLLTSLINDFPPEQCFARQVQAHGKAGDVLAAFSTSGNSENVRLAIEQANQLDMHTIAFLGKSGGSCKGLAAVELIVPSDTTARIQEAHLLMYHTICQILDPLLAEHSRKHRH